MSTFLRDARDCAEWIDHYYAHAGEAGYSQALYHEQELEKLFVSANRSTRGKSDSIAIRAIIESVRPKMEEMKKLENEAAEHPAQGKGTSDD